MPISMAALAIRCLRARRDRTVRFHSGIAQRDCMLGMRVFGRITRRTDPAQVEADMSGASPTVGGGRPETDLQRWDRNFSELLQELRVAQTGVQILFGFLLTVPFSARFSQATT